MGIEIERKFIERELSVIDGPQALSTRSKDGGYCVGLPRGRRISIDYIVFLG